ncbi:MAG: glutamine-hydrolyzing carbamoyl-phosphate synthase small subunit [Clostridiales bacterium]|nr:glutamine-hydrolyzing carbamoyl-phosphate synthase small subunit [Clostridiales bacterium]HOA84777.1 carbamoyl phosphate synthase small subunit [Bacillota bacterium]
MKKAYLVLEDGTVFLGEKFGADTENVGELVFTTNMCGYIETLTDPSYYGQIVLQTFPLIGNYGIIEEDFEGPCCVRGYVVREWCDYPSNFRCQYDLDKFLKDHNVVGLCSIDTRQVTRIIREHGVMNAAICDSVPEDLSFIKNYSIKDAVPSVSRREKTVYPAENEKYRVALIDYGAKNYIIKSLQFRGCSVTVFPATTSAEEILAFAPDGLVLPNGPGDPAENKYQIEQLEKLLGRLPIFGICLGHQLLALAAGSRTIKLKYGHRGANQPVRDLFGTRTYITSQNHGYAVDNSSIKCGVPMFQNANDGTCEGIDYPDLKAFSVQFHPEASAGPLDTSFLFDRFTRMMDAEGGSR